MSRKKKETEETPVVFNDPFGTVTNAVGAFVQRWQPLPYMSMPCEVMDQSQLRDAMGVYESPETGDGWQFAEKLLLEQGFRWHMLGGSRVMFLREREDAIVDDGWQEAMIIDN